MDMRTDNRQGNAGLRTIRAPLFVCALRAALLALVCCVFACGTTLAAPLLKQGAEGHDVSVLQKNLKTLGYELEVTGVFDETTYRAVVAFQHDEKLQATGTVDRETWRTLRLRAEKGAKAPTRDAQARGARDPAPKEENTPPVMSPPKKTVPEASAPGTEKVSRTRGKKDAETTKKESAPPAVSAPESAAFLPKAKAEAIIGTAKKYKGTHYRFGGTTPKGFDCSGFLQYVFKQHGFSIPRTADEQYKLGKRVKKRAELVPGDLVFFSTYEPGASHCGIYLGHDQFIHVSSSRGVRIDSLDDEYWKPRWYGGKHIVKK